MRRQQLASVHGDICGSKRLDFGITEDSDSEGSSEARTALEAWSIIPNTFADDVFQHFMITPIPVSQQQIAKLVKISPQDYLEVASVIDSLSIRERDAILGGVLDMRHSRSLDSTIRLISTQDWKGSCDLFGKVTGRKFRLVIERQVKIPKRAPTGMKARGTREAAKKAQHYYSDSSSPTYDSFSDVDDVRDSVGYKHDASPSPPPRDNRRRRAHARRVHVPEPPSEFQYRERKRPVSDNDRKRRQEIEEAHRRDNDERYQNEDGVYGASTGIRTR